MFEKNMRFAFLLDFYSDIIDPHTKEILKAYYEDDLSLAEIAEDEGISRQGVRHIIKKGEDELEFFESKLELAAKAELTESAIKKIDAVIDDLKTNGDALFSEDISMLEDVASILNT